MRLTVPAAGAAMFTALAVAGAPAVLLPATAARAADAVFLELNPSTVRAGDVVSLRASCNSNAKAATVTAAPIGSVPVEPDFNFLTATVTVPADQKAGDYKVTLHCPDDKTASANLHVVAKVEPARGPATGGGGTAPGPEASLLVGGGLTVMVAAGALALLSVRRRRPN
ncbi:hypothetical protein [Actinoplanes awajinensis]|uniref:Gram-positive cocci surface proteins LPxTG domain-containing protein n=1 Tax=Actinoplanes awajinensis subsp. mycoplanecinus TaxID=135947 RepID=A0A124G7X1_9ACTN|nr:hypothetical protein [Actinoplanes awajinensis]KUL24190.1 hypothetical protein ADL15_44115 [Actinoplanes awajinensis subsp. mycoplanecinus]